MTQDAADVAAIGEDTFDLWASFQPGTAALAGRISAQIGLPRAQDAARVADDARAVKSRLEKVDPKALSRRDELTRRYLDFELGKLIEQSKLHDFAFEITPYQIAGSTSGAHQVLATASLSTARDRENFEELVRQYAEYFVRLDVALREQAARGVVAPASAIPGCLATLRGLAAALENILLPSAARLSSLDPSTANAFVARLIRIVENDARPAIQRSIDYIGGDYARRAPDRVGLAQYRGGLDAYTMLIRHHTTESLTPEALHAKGIALVSEIESEMARIRDHLGVNMSGPDFLERLAADDRFYCKSAEETGALFRGLLKKCEAVFPKAFGMRKFPTYAVERLAAMEEEGMTFGYYQPPSFNGAQLGAYKFNGSKLNERMTIGAASLIYHEILPGHHLHIGTEMCDASRPNVRRFPTITAFNEGWAEYAADLGWELGLYDNPYDQYGRLLLRSFLASRLVVDTGLNAFGWPLDRARAYMREHSAMSATEIASEILRYSTSIPGQALGYALGRQHFWDFRRKAEAQLGSAFDLPDFHSAILEGGSLPIGDLAFSLDNWVAEHKASGAGT
ncbi:MAG TPA: DUF885 domain-containing protein [Methylovirgula sp.]